MAEATNAGGVAPAALEEIDLLKLQNAFLRLHALNVQAGTIKSQFEVLRRDALRVDKEAEEAKGKLEAVRAHISEKYGVDLKRVTVDDGGRFIPLRPAQVPFPVDTAPDGGART